MLSPDEVAGRERGQILKRYIRAAAALHDLFDDTALADAVGVSRGAVGAWWQGTRMEITTIDAVARATGLSSDSLTGFLYRGGEPPVLERGLSPVLEGARRAERRQGDTDPDRPSQQPGQHPRGTGAGRG